MNRGALIFLFLIPAFIALGHDIYLYYINVVVAEGFDIGVVHEKFKFSALGFILTTYTADLYKELVRITEPDPWDKIDAILTIPAFYAGLAFAAFMTVLFTIPAFFGYGPFSSTKSQGRSSSGDSFSRAGAGNKKFEYKRK